MSMALGQWCGRMRESRAARKAWNKGVPTIEREQARHASEHYASYWTGWAKELVMTQQVQYSPRSETLAALVHQDFWRATLLAFKDKPVEYWFPLVGLACRNGNLSVLDAFVHAFGAQTAIEWIGNFSLVHPRIVGWSVHHGERSHKHILDLISTRWGGHNFGVVFDAQTGRQGGKAMFDWVKDWVLLPDGMVGPRQGYQVAAHISGLLDACLALPGPREGNGMPALVHGHGHRTYDAWQDDSHMDAPLVASDALQMLHVVYARFGFEPQLMDTLLGRWTKQDLDNPHVCALVYMRHHQQSGPGPRMAFEQWEQVTAQAHSQGLLLHALQWQAPNLDVFSMYGAAVDFFRPPPTVDAGVDLAGLLDFPGL